MTAPNSRWSEITTTALLYRIPKMFDNMSKQIAIVHRLHGKGRVKKVGGGEDIVCPLEYAENNTYKRYSGYQTLNIAPSEVFSAANYSWKQIAIAVSISGLEQLQNSGKTRKFDLLKSRIGNAERTFYNNFASDLYSDGTSANQIGGLQSIIADTATSGTVGGIDRSTYTWWRNVSTDATTDYGAAMTASNVQSYMNRFWLSLVRNKAKPDLILADNNYYRLYWDSLQAIQRIEQTKMAEAGFEALKYKAADVVYDGGADGACPSDHMYFLDTDTLFLAVHKDRNLSPLEPDRFAVNQDAMVKLLAFAGNLCCAYCRNQCVLKD